MSRSPTTSSVYPARTEVRLLNGLELLVDGRHRDVPEGSKRLLALMSLHREPLDRRYVAGSLWPTCGDDRSAGNLRSALWRLRGCAAEVIHCDHSTLALRRHVQVDIDRVQRWADRIAAGRPQPDDFHDLADKVRALDILPGCYDDWVVLERERLRQLVLHGLEDASRLAARARLFGVAVEAAMAAVFCEPLRESAQRALIDAHLAEGNVVEAQRAVRRFAEQLRDGLGIDAADELYLRAHMCPSRPTPTVCHSDRRHR